MKTADLLALPAPKAAPLLLGWELRRLTAEGVIGVRIVETEAYHQEEPASHSHRGPTARTAPLFQAGGTIYVYFTYGMHYCLNVVTGIEGTGEGVLIRAAEPLEGLELIRRNRGRQLPDRQLTNGPGKVAQALGITSTAWSGKKFSARTLRLLPPSVPVDPTDIVSSGRIGIRQASDLPWRFYERGNRFVSGPADLL